MRKLPAAALGLSLLLFLSSCGLAEREAARHGPEIYTPTVSRQPATDEEWSAWEGDERIQEYSPQMYKEGLELGGDLNRYSRIQDGEHFAQHNVLIHIAQHSDYAELKSLLELGANPNVMQGGYTPLMHLGRSERYARLLLEYGANPSFGNTSDISAWEELLHGPYLFQASIFRILPLFLATEPEWTTPRKLNKVLGILSDAPTLPVDLSRQVVEGIELTRAMEAATGRTAEPRDRERETE